MLKENYKMNEVLKVIYSANLLGIKLWVENNALKFKSPENIDSSTVLSELKKYRNEVIEILLQNKVLNSESNQKHIYHLENNQSILSFGQERLWFIEQYEEGSNVYHIPEIFELDLHINIEGIKYALTQIVLRHEILRSTIYLDESNDGGIQKVLNETLTIEEVTLLESDDLASIITKDINRPFKLHSELPIRIKLYFIHNEKNDSDSTLTKIILSVNTHHISTDGWSMKIFQEELVCFYEAYVNKTKLILPDLEIQYKDYAIWQRFYLKGEIYEKELSYWKSKISGFQNLEFPIDYIRPSKVQYEGEQLDFKIDQLISDKLRKLAQNNGTTLNSVLMASLNILLGKYCGQDDIVIGSATANRQHSQTESLIGFFVNIQAHRTFLKPDQSFNELIVQIHNDQKEAQLYQELPFEKLVSELNIERDPSRHPIFQVTFEVQSFDYKKTGNKSTNNYLKPFKIEGVCEAEKFDLSILIDDSEDELIGQMSYATSLFNCDSIARFTNHYLFLLQQLIEDPKKQYSTINLLNNTEYEQIMYSWNSTDSVNIPDKTIQVLFEEQVLKTPDNIALVFEGKTLTFKELNEKSNQLAHFIVDRFENTNQKPLTPDTLIALFLDRRLEMIIGILAVLKAGAAYVPIDTNYSQERIEFIVNDINSEFLISLNHLTENKISNFSKDRIINIDLSSDLYINGNKSKLNKIGDLRSLAYVIYTSGTTGLPKGVMIEQLGLVNLIQDLLVKYELKNSERFLFFSNYVFDASIEQLFLSLLSGGTLYIVNAEKILDSDHLVDFINEHKITHLDATPTYFSTINPIDIKEVKRIIFGAEFLSKSLFDNYKATIPFIINAYGPTEATITSIISINSDLLHKATIKNTKIYILDANLLPVPIGVVGELYIGGAGLARGYLNQEELTAERFISNPFATEKDIERGFTRLYKTGDLVKWLPDGNIAYIGRNDDQLKIRGYRIELGEIENALSEISGIKQCSVIAKTRKKITSENSYIVGYYVLDPNGDKPSQTYIEEELKKKLPEYMVPAALVEMEAFPLTINGKLDKKALPDADFSSADDQYVAPVTRLELRTSQIFASVLGLDIEQISMNKSFFNMGGNSILTIQLKQKLNQLDEFEELTIADIFKYNSIQKLIESIQEDTSAHYKLQNLEQNTNHEIAIIAVSGAFSGVKDVREFWDLISNQQEGVQFYTKEECQEKGIENSLLEDPNFIPVSGQVENIDFFDPIFWGLSPNEAKQLDPQIRKFIEHCWFALESSGYILDRKNQNIGVFAGSGSSDYFNDHIVGSEISEHINIWEAYNANSKDALATKTSYLLGLSGPSNSINTACSTGLVSVVEACKNLQLGTCSMALAGGVSLSMPDEIGYLYQEGMIMSKNGHCNTFDNEATGTTVGSGVGVVVLKRLTDAVRDGDTIHGVIKGYATNNDGDRKIGYTAPSVIGQSECIINAQKMAGISSDQVEYIECHGTATSLGDVIEFQSLKEAFIYNQPKEEKSVHTTILGAVKANIGHTDSAAGTASLIKVCSMLHHNVLPGQVNFTTPNAQFNFSDTNFKISAENTPWLPSINKQRIAGVSSFGIGGTNAHVIIGDYSVPTKQENSNNTTNNNNTDCNYIIPISAKSRESLENYKKALLLYLTQIEITNASLKIEDIAYTLQEKREHYNYRSSYCTDSITDLVEQLKLNHSSFTEILVDENNQPTIFMFPGQGSQYTEMAKELYLNETFFKATVDHCVELANNHIEIDLLTVIYPDGNSSDFNIHETQWAQISLFIIEFALAKYIEQMGIKADAYIGHSIGEYVAATLSGVFSLEDAIKVVISRGKLMQSMLPGSMLAIFANEHKVKEIIEGFEVEIAAINSLEDSVITGSEQAIESIKKEFDNQGIASIKLTTSHAYHSKMMEEASVEFEKVIEAIQLNSPTKIFISNLTGEIAREEVITANYWSCQLRNTVQFEKGIQCISKHFDNQLLFIEVGTGKGLSSFVNKYKTTNGLKTIQTIQLLPSEKEALVNKKQFEISKEGYRAKFWMSGLFQKANDPKLFQNALFDTDLPGYQFKYEKCWIEKKKKTASTKSFQLLKKEEWFSSPVWSAVSNLNTDRNQFTSKPFRKSLVFLRIDQFEKYDFSNLSIETQFILFDSNESEFKHFEGLAPFKMDAENELHFKELAEYLKNGEIVFDTIIHLSSIDNKSNLEEGLTNSFYSLFLIRQFLLNNVNLENLLVLTNGLAQITNEDGIISSNGTLIGTVRNINHEYIHIDAKIIDIGNYQTNTPSHVTDIVTNSLYRKNEELIAIKYGKLWIERFEQMKYSNSTAEVIENGDVILITGIGFIALAIAKFISDKHTVKFIFVSRSNSFDKNQDSTSIKQKKEIINTIIKNGSEVSIMNCDLSDRAQVETLITKSNNQFGSITGVIHTAGAFPLDPENYNINNIKEAFKGKVYGIENVLHTISLNDVKFISSTSSLASVLGDVNRIEYCATNSYLDYLSVDKLRFKDIQITTINWPGWIENDSNQTLGDEHQSEDLDKLMSLNSVRYNEGGELFYDSINQRNQSQIVISKLNLIELRKELFSQKTMTKLCSFSILEDSYTEFEFLVAQACSEILGIDKLSIYDDFFKIGGNSILAIQLSHKINKILKVDIKVTDVFKLKNCKAIVENIKLLEVDSENIRMEF